MKDNFYIFNIRDSKIRSYIYDLGVTFDTIDCKLKLGMVNKKSFEQKEIDKNSYLFLIDNDLIDKNRGHGLTATGKKLFEALYIYNDEKEANRIFRDLLLKNPIVNLIEQVYYGRGKTSIDQLVALLNYHKVSQEVLTSSNIVSLLNLLNNYGIVTYDKKNRIFSINEQSFETILVKQYFVNPTTPFSNIYNLRKCIRSCSGTLYWIDKHFRKQGFEILLDGLPANGIKKIVIISGPENVTESAKVDYKNLKNELLSRDIKIQWGIIKDSNFKWHDRWLIADNVAYNIPPVLAVIKGQRSEIIQTDIKINITDFLNNCEFLKV